MTQPAAPEILEKQAISIVDALCIDQDTDAKRKALLESIQTARAKDPSIWITISKKLSSMEKGPQRDIANTNLGKLRDRIDATVGFADAEVAVQTLRDELDLLQKNLSSPAPSVENPVTGQSDPKKNQEPKILPATTQDIAYEEADSSEVAEPTLATKKPETVFDPTSWSPEHQQQAKDIAIVGGVVVVGAIVLSKLSAKAKGIFGKIKMAVGIGVAGVLGYLGLQTYRKFDAISGLQKMILEKERALAKVTGEKAQELEEEVRALKQKLADAKNTPKVVDGATDFAKEAKEEAQRRVELNAFVFEHKKQLGDLEEREMIALSTFINNEKIQKLSLQDFVNATPQSLLDHTPNESESEIFTSLKAIVQERMGKYETMKEFFGDTFMGGITARVKEAIGDASITDIKTEKIAQAALGGIDQFRALIEKKNVQEGLQFAGVPKERSVQFIEKILLNGGKHIDDAVRELPEFSAALGFMKNAVQQEDVTQLIADFGHQKGKANDIIREHILSAGATHLTLRDTVELYMYTQLMKGEDKKLPKNIKDGNPLGSYLMQMKALDLLSRSQDGERASKGVKMFLLFRGIDAATGLNPNISLPPEVLEQLQEITQSLLKAIVNKLVKTGSNGVDIVVEAEAEFRRTYPDLYKGLALGGAVAIGAEIKNMARGFYLRALAKANPRNMFSHGIYSESVLPRITQNAADYKAMQKLCGSTIFKRIPGISQIITSHYIEIDRYEKLMGWADANTQELLVHFMENRRLSHINASVIDQVKILAQNAKTHSGAAIASGGRGVGILERTALQLQGTNLSLSQKLTNLVKRLDGIDVALVDKTHDVIDKIAKNIMPVADELRALGLSEERVAEMVDVFSEASIGRKVVDPLPNPQSLYKDPNIPEPPKGADKVDDAADPARTNPSDPDPSAKAPDASTSAPKDPTNAGDAGKAANAAEDAADAKNVAGAAEAAEQVTDAKTLAKIDDLLGSKQFSALLKESGRTPDEVKAILNQIEGCDPDTLAKIRMSPKAQRMLAGAYKVKGVEGITQEAAHVLKIANRAKAIRLGFNAFGAGLDVFGFAMAFVDMSNNNDRIKSTQNPELQEIYGNANYIYAGEAGTSIAGIAYAGTYMYLTGGSIGTALSASAGLVMLPIGAAVFAARQTHESLEKSAVYHTINERDMTREYSPGKIVQHIAGSSSVQRHTWTQDFFDSKLMDTANLGARSEGYIAYFRQIAPAYVPPAMPFNLHQRPPEGENIEELLEKENNERISFFIRKSLDYVRTHSNAKFEVKDAGCMESAALYAQKCFGEQYVMGKEPVREAGVSEKVFQDKFVSDYQVERQKERISYIASLANEGRASFAEKGIPLFVEMLRHDLAFCERAILDCPDYSNISTGSGDEYMKTLARGYIASELWSALDQLRTATVTEETIIASLEAIQNNILNKTDMKSVANAAYDSPSREQFLSYGSDPTRLSVVGLMEHIKSYPFLAPKVISNDRNNPTRFSALELHSDRSKQYTLRPSESGPNQYHISGLNGWRFSRDQTASLEKRWSIKSDVFTFSADPGDAVYLWKPPHSAIGTPDFTLFIAKQRQTPKKLAA